MMGHLARQSQLFNLRVNQSEYVNIGLYVALFFPKSQNSEVQVEGKY